MHTKPYLSSPNPTTLPLSLMPLFRPLSRISKLFQQAKHYTSHRLPPPPPDLPPERPIHDIFHVFSWTIRGLLLTHLFMTHGYTISPTFGPSMSPTFSGMGDYCLTSKYYRRGRDVKVSNTKNDFHLHLIILCPVNKPCV